MNFARQLDLREKYREEAALFLTLSSHECHNYKKAVKQHRSKEELYNPIITARSLILKSMYDGYNEHGGGMVVKHDFYCLCCGNALLPLGADSYTLPNIKLKSLKRSKTRRRRASRQRAKKIAFDTMVMQKHRGGGRTFARQSGDSHGSAVCSVMSTIDILKKRHALSGIRDGGGKNCISYTCSNCGQEKLFKGLPPRKNIEDDELAKSNHGGKKPISTSSVRRSGDVQTSSVSKDDSGFISLGTPSRTPTKILKPLEQGRKKKRQKKTKKTGLSEFLSSLND